MPYPETKAGLKQITVTFQVTVIRQLSLKCKDAATAKQLWDEGKLKHIPTAEIERDLMFLNATEMNFSADEIGGD